MLREQGEGIVRAISNNGINTVVSSWFESKNSNPSREIESIKPAHNGGARVRILWYNLRMSNPVGSLELPRVLYARKNLSISLTERQREILIGCILGDAYIALLGKIRVEHSIKQKAYVEWKFKEFQSVCYAGGPREIIHKLKAMNGKEYHSLFFLFRQYFREWRNIFYLEKQKIFPKDLWLTPLSIAVWYMDDGCWTGKKAVISTESFKGIYRTFMQNALFNQFGIETVIGKNEKLIIRKRSHNRFFNLITPHIIPEMRYKIPNPVTTFHVK